MIDDDDADRDDALFLRAFDRLAGPRPDVRAGWADLGQRALDRPIGRPGDAPVGRPAVPVRTGRHAPRLAVLAAVAVTAALVGFTVRRAGSPDPTSPAAVSTAAPATTGRPATTAAGRAPTSGPVATVPAVVTGGSAAVPTAAPAPTDATEVTTAPASSGRGGPAPTSPGRGIGAGTVPSPPTGSATPAPTAPAGTPVPVATEAPGPQRVVVTGGVISVPVVGGHFGVPTVTADPGWTYEVRKAEADRIEVRFRGSGGESRVRLTLRSDGSIAVERG